MLKNKHILLGITGSIAAYKAAELARAMVRAGAEVRVVMTPCAREFITPLTMATVSRNPILVDFFDPEDGRWNSHVSLGEWADAYVIAPATANTLAKMATGVADNLLLTTCLSARCPVFVAPAMDLDMFAHATTQANLATLRGRGVCVVEPGEGELASGLVGKGRMAEPLSIADYVGRALKKKTLTGRRVVVTAGPTVEELDPVRFLSNYSTGKMGYALAGELAARGAEVVLVSGPVFLDAPLGVSVVSVRAASEMFSAVREAFESADGAILCAAVADYAPLERSASKIKKEGVASVSGVSGVSGVARQEGGGMVLELRRTPDIALELGMVKGARLLVGFALETDNEEANARGKMERKNLDYIVLNSLNDKGAGFGGDTNKVSIMGRDGSCVEVPLMSKREVAAAIVDVVERWFGGHA